MVFYPLKGWLDKSLIGRDVMKSIGIGCLVSVSVETFGIQGRPHNVNYDASCVVGKIRGEVEKVRRFQKIGGKWKSLVCKIAYASLLLGGMDAPGDGY